MSAFEPTQLEKQIAALAAEASLSWPDALQKSVLPIADFRIRPVPRRESVVGDWFLEGDLGFVFGPRGLGKTWLSMHLGVSISEGTAFGPWKIKKPRRVLYVDGEMAMDASIQRANTLSQADGGLLEFLHHEELFQSTGRVLNLSSLESQQALLDYAKARGIEVIILDNLSCLFSGINENDADSWEMVLPWLLSLRRNRISVVFIHHAGRAGTMRGTSRREDAAFWIIQLSEVRDTTTSVEGARFAARFTKNRNAMDSHTPAMEWAFGLGPDGKTSVVTKELCAMFLLHDCVLNGLTSATDIAEELGITKGQVSKLATKAKAKGWLTMNGREYALVSGALVVS